MKYTRIILTLFAVTVLSCAKDTTGDVSSVTTYPEITIIGDEIVYVEQGSPYVDAGAIAKEGDTEIETIDTFDSGTYTDTAFGTDVPDSYTVTYSATNSDGFDGKAIRTVIVIPPTSDLVTSISGLYTSSVQRAPDFTVLDQFNDLEYVYITETAENTFTLSHAIGGYYDLGRGYGPDYAAVGAVITANDIATNDFTITQAAFPAWGNTVDITEFTVDSATKTITFTGDGNFGNGTFKVQLKQVEN